MASVLHLVVIDELALARPLLGVRRRLGGHVGPRIALALPARARLGVGAERVHTQRGSLANEGADGGVVLSGEMRSKSSRSSSVGLFGENADWLPEPAPGVFPTLPADEPLFVAEPPFLGTLGGFGVSPPRLRYVFSALCVALEAFTAK